jgi:hypothetical protein
VTLPDLYLPRVWMGSQMSAQFLPSTIRPLSAHIKLTENCQAKCISCDYWKSRWQDGIDTGRAIELVNRTEALGIRSLRLTGGEPLKPVGNILRDSLETILASDAYYRQAISMIRRECPGCTCSVESSLAMKHVASSAFFELSRRTRRQNSKNPTFPVEAAQLEKASRT